METAQPDVAIHEMNKHEPEQNDDFEEGSGNGGIDDEDYVDDGHGFVWNGDEWESKEKVETETEPKNKDTKDETKQNSKEDDLKLDQQ